MASFRQSLSQFDKGKIIPAIALRNSLAVALPLAIGVAMGKPSAGLIAAIGALNVSYSDGTDPYFFRARRMLAASILVALAIFTGCVTAGHMGFSVLLTAACAFGAGLLVAISQPAGDIGNVTLVTLIVFSAHAMPTYDAMLSALLGLGGGLLQTTFALALWPVRKHAPERRALAAFYAELARAASAPPVASEAPPASRESTQAQHELKTLSTNPSLEGERYLSLLSQAERIRLGLMTLSRLRVRLSRDADGQPWLPRLARCLDLASRLLAAVAQSLLSGQPAAAHTGLLAELSDLAQQFRTAAEKEPSADVRALLREAYWQVEALAGQLRSAEEIGARISPSGAAAFAKREADKPWRLRLTGPLAVLRANVTLQSAAFRHALRLAVCVAAGESLAHAVDWQRSYWLPMTIAIVLRPDFTGTFSRGAARLLGTLIGLALATALFHAFSPSIGVQTGMIFLLTFLLRGLGPANYGIFVIVLSALIVQLLAIGGTPPAQVIWARGINTFAGGVIALLAYALWPTWERALLGEALARLLDAYRGYFDAVRESYIDPQGPHQAELDHTRLASRLARSNLEASALRLRSEPGISPARLTRLDAILANSHRFIHAVMALEAGLGRSRAVPSRPAFRPFTEDVDRTLERLASRLRGAIGPPADFPDLREDHLQLLHAGDPHVERYELVNIETDRITNSLNTLREEILRWDL